MLFIETDEPEELQSSDRFLREHSQQFLPREIAAPAKQTQNVDLTCAEKQAVHLLFLLRRNRPCADPGAKSISALSPFSRSNSRRLT
jgi:hypothetical protein